MRSRDDLACDLAFDLASDLAFHDLAFDLAASSRSRRDLATREQVHGKRVVQMTEAQRQEPTEAQRQTSTSRHTRSRVQ